jgi:hypothetical protein
MWRLFSFVGIVALMILGFGLGVVYMLLPRTAVTLNQDSVVDGVAVDDVRVELKNDAGQYIDIQPKSEATTLFIFYPGGLVRPQAYEWLGVALAPLGVRTIIPIFTADLAVTAPNRATQLLEKFSSYDRVILGGHSLGGAMAARYMVNHPERADALLLLAAFSAERDDLSTLDLPIFVLAGEHDKVATLEEVKAGMARLPRDAKLVVIEGAVHSFFGRYGPQRGDGVPTVSRAQAEKDIRSSLSEFLDAEGLNID